MTRTYHPCPGCGQPLRTCKSKARPQYEKKTKRQPLTKLCLSCRIERKQLPTPIIDASYPQYGRWLREIAQHVKEISR